VLPAPRTHRPALTAILVGLLASLLPAVAVAASGVAPAVSATTVPAAADFATETFGDAWDMEQATDVRIARETTVNVASHRYADGVLEIEASGPNPLVNLLWFGFPGSLHTGRQGAANPIDGSRFTHITMRLWMPDRGRPELQFDRARVEEVNQNRNTGFTSPGVIEGGWQTVTFTPGWSGPIYALRLSLPIDPGERARIDDVRVHTAPQAVEVTFPPEDGPLYWDRDANLANNTEDDPGWGEVPSEGGRGVFLAGAYPPGTYRFYTEAGQTYGAELEVKGPPAPQILDPDLAGGEDYATAQTGNPWDFASIHDVVHLANVSDVSFGPGGLAATNGPPNQNDPYFYLRIGPTGIDPNRYHRLTVRTTYDGPFDLGDFAGGGTHGRIGWGADFSDIAGGSHHDPNRRPGPGRAEIIQGNQVVQAREFVHFPDESFTADLATDPPSAVMETDLDSRQGWPGAWIHYLRYDPNEDRGTRRWRVHGIELRATDAATGDVFDIRWRDANPDRPEATSVDLYYGTDPSGVGGTLIAGGLPQTAGENTFRWSTRAVPYGRYWISLVATDGLSTTRTVSSGPLDVRPDLRVRGPERVSTAAALSYLGFPHGAPAVVVARDREFPDALAAAPLAAAAGGPLLLNPRGSLSAVVRAEIGRLGARTVYLMGGEAAQSATVEQGLRSIPGVTVVRLSGPDRFATAAAAGQEAVRLWRASGHTTAGSRALIALGTDFPDALGAGPLAAHSRQPLLLAQRDAIPEATLVALDAYGTTSVTVVGGPAAVSDAAAASTGRPTRRVAGPTRVDTAAQAAREAVQAGADGGALIVASGRTFADALAAGPAVYARRGVLLLTEPGTLSAPTAQWVVDRRGQMRLLRVAGGAAAVTDGVEAALHTANR
jgi:putative cell wall-binding protein